MTSSPLFETPAVELLRDKEIAGRSIECMDRFAEAMGGRLREGMRLLDYGCGSGRFGAYLATRLEEFTYWGFDLREQVERWADMQMPLRRDRRYGFDELCNLEKTGALKHATDALLLSVLTHLPHGYLFAVLQRLWPIAKHGGVIFASLYVGEYLAVGMPKHIGEDGIPSYRRQVIYTQRSIEEVCAALDLKCERVGTWTKQWEQTIMAFRRGDRE